jgi:hypothetical protein
MSRQNVELVRGLDDVLNLATGLRSQTAFISMWSSCRFEGFIADTFEVFEKFEPHCEVADLGEQVLAWGHIHVRARGSGIETDIETGDIFEFREGKIVRWEDFGSKVNTLEAAGLSERDARVDT